MRGGRRSSLIGALAAAIAGPAAAQDSFLVPAPAPDGRLTLGAESQFRYTTSIEQSPVNPDDEVATGFGIRRIRLRARGALGEAERAVTYFIQTEGNTGDVRLLDLFIEGTLAEGLKIGAGQFVLPFAHEELVPNFRLLTPEFSTILFSINPATLLRTRGVMLTAQRDQSRAYAALTDGTEAISSSFNNATDGEAVTLRVERALIGELSAFTAYTAPPGTPRALLAGLAGHAERRDTGGDRWAWTADLTYKDDGFNASVAGFGHAAEDLTLGPNPRPEHAFGVVALAGVYVADDVEPFVRYQFGTTSDDNHPDLSLIEAGCNVYFAGHALRFSGDVGYAFERIGPVFQRPIDGLRVSGNGTPGEVIIRLQLQFLF